MTTGIISEESTAQRKEQSSAAVRWWLPQKTIQPGPYKRTSYSSNNSRKENRFSHISNIYHYCLCFGRRRYFSRFYEDLFANQFCIDADRYKINLVTEKRTEKY